MERLRSCRFERMEEVALPAGTLLWTPHQYYDGASWLGLREREKLEMRPTRWNDARLRFLDPIEELPEAFKAVQSGDFDVKCWSKGDCMMGVEGDNTVMLKTPLSPEVTVYVHPERLPAYTKSWKPIAFLLNSSVATFRLTENVCLVVTRQEDGTISINCADYNGGFACAHPKLNLAAAYGSFAVRGFEKLKDCTVVPHVETSSGDWGFFVQFYPWGFLFIPKSVELSRPQSVLGAVGIGKKVETIGLVFCPPNLLVYVKLEIPSKTVRTVQFGKDFRVTAKASSETDIDIYAIVDEQLVKYNYSFDLRLNKPEKPKHVDSAYIKCTIEGEDKKKPDAKYKLVPSKNVTILLNQGCPPGGPTEQLVSEQVIACYDAEICMYYSHPPAVKLTDAFTELAVFD